MGLVRTAQLVAYLCTTSLESVLGAMAPFATVQPSLPEDSLLPEISEPLVHAVESGAMTPHAASTMAQTIADHSAASHSRVYSAERRVAKARTAQAHRPQHRQLQEVIETVGDGSKEVWTAALRDGLWGYLPDLQGGFYQDGSVCTDPRAINANQAGADSCAYDCAQLLEFYFGGDNDEKNKCFLYDEATQGWWDGGEARAGQETEMELIAAHRTSKLEWWVLLEPTDGLGDIPEFTVGEGPVCRNVTKLNTSDPAALTAALYEDPEALGSSSALGHNETSCLLEGLHHAAGFTHFAVEGEEEFAPVCMEGDTICDNLIMVGECTDVLIRVMTSEAFAPGPDVTWSLSCGDDCHMGPWTHTCSGMDCAGTHEYYTCLFDNHYTLDLVSQGSGWSGAVSVSTYVPDNSIEVPPDENWIIQGASTNGVPIELDARIFSGNPWALTNASIILRHIRLSGQQGTLDPYWTGGPLDSARGFSGRPFARQGGAFYYEGGFGSTVTLDHVVIDHSGAESVGGGAGVLAGRAERFTPDRCAQGISEDEWNDLVAQSFDDVASKGRCHIIPGTSTRSCPRPKTGVTETTAFPPAANAAGCGTRVSILNSLFWANTGFSVGGIRGVNMFWYANYVGNSWVDNDAVVGHDHGYWVYASVKNNFGNQEYRFVDETYVLTPHCSEDAYKNPYGQGVFCNAGLCTGPTLFSFAGGGAVEGEDNSVSIYQEDVEIKDVLIWYCPMGLQMFAASDGEIRQVWLRPSMRNNAGTWTVNPYQTSWLYVQNNKQAYEQKFSHGLWDNNFIPQDTEAASVSQGAHLYLQISTSASVEYSMFAGGRATIGGGIYCMGTGSLTVAQCSFMGNTAVAEGGAITFASNGAELLVRSSIFVGNVVEPPFGGDPKPAIYVRVYTGSTGVPKGEVNSQFGYTLPVFKIDGVEPYTVCNGVPAGCGSHARTPELRECDVEPRPCDPGQRCSVINRNAYPYTWPTSYPWAVVPGQNCFDGDVPMDEKVYGGHRPDSNDTALMEQYSDYAEVINLSPGRHTLWYGIRVDTSVQWLGWTGFGWIDIVGILDPIYPTFFDYRTEADADNTNGYTQLGYAQYAIDTFCWSGSPLTNQTQLCETEHTLWRKVEFEVPFGEGGAIKSTGSGSTIRISNSTFENNNAGSGTVLKAVGASEIVIVDSQQQAGDTAVTTQPVAMCSVGACDLGQQCTLSDTGVSGYLCNEPCPVNAYGDGYNCVECGPGTQPGCPDETECPIPTGCVVCAPNEVSTNGLCRACGTGSFPNSEQTICVPCPAGEISVPDGSACQACPAGTTNRDDGLACETCAARGANLFSVGGGGGCDQCQAGKQPNANRTNCEQCPSGTYSTAVSTCERCPSGQEHVNQQVCSECADGKYNTGEFDQCIQCPAGHQPNADKKGCQSCNAEGRNTYSNRGDMCVACAIGTIPNENRTACMTCEPGGQPNEDQSGCESCGAYEGTFSAAGMECVACPPRQTPTADRTACTCQSGTYNIEQYGKITCHGLGEGGDLDTCVTCPHCLKCSAEETSLRDGWAFFGQGDAYLCPAKDEYGNTVGCPGGPLPNQSTAEATWFREPYTNIALESQCTEGYAGPICGSCKSGWSHLRVGKPCSSCDGNTINVVSLLVALVGLLVVGSLVVSGAIKVMQDYGLMTDILSQMQNVIDVTFPEPVPTFAEYLKLLMVDVRTVVNLDCWSVGGFYGKLWTNLLVVPVLFVSVCAFVWSSQRRTIGQVIAAGGADESAYVTANVKLQQNLMFGIFLLYPMITTTLFRIPQCREIGDRWFHEEDFSVECDTGFIGVITFAVVMIVAVPIGVPLIFLIGMKRAKDQLGGPRMTALGGAKLSGEEVSDEDDRFGFLVRDLKPEYWYYEIVIYVRKLLLGGMSIIVGRGTMAQAYFVASIESIFLMHHFRSYPYALHKHNVLDGFGHTALVLTYMATLILRHDNDTSVWANEWFPKSGYGYVIVFLYVVVLPSPSIYFYFKHRNDGEQDDSAASISEDFTNPLGDAADSNLFDASDAGSSTKDARRLAGPLESRDQSRNPAFSPAAVAKLNRVARENRVENEVLTKQVTELSEQNEQLRMSVIASGGDLSTMPQTRTNRRSKSTAVAEPEQESEAPPVDPQQSSILAMKALAQDESLSEENRAAAKEALDTRVSNTIENELADATLHRLQRRVQQEDSVEMVNKARLESIRKRNAVAFEKVQDARMKLREWLGDMRLIAHEQRFLDVCGVDMSVSDLKYLRQEDIDQLTETMSWVESRRLAEAIEAMKTDED